MLAVRSRAKKIRDVIRRRMIRETEAALEYALEHPENIIPIPTIEVGKGNFSPDYARWFWQHALELNDDDPVLK